LNPLGLRLAIGSLAALLAVGLLAAAGPTPGYAQGSVVTAAFYTTDAKADWGVKTVSYSTAETGHKLQWSPCRPSKEQVRRDSQCRATRRAKEQFAQYTSPAEPKPTDEGTMDPFDDPFADGQTMATEVPPKKLLNDQLLEGPDAEPILPNAVPQITIGEATVDEKGAESTEDIPRFLPDDELAVAPTIPEDMCSSVKIKPINEITHDVSAKGDMFPTECPLPEGALPDRVTYGWAPTTFTWKASALCHKPPYFNDDHLERYGHSWGPYLQPVISGAHFFLTVPVLPYKMGLYPPNECVYTLGYYRPGSCAPYMLDPLPISIRAGLYEAAVWTGMPFLIP
jgi:hypothetical protein